MPKAASTLVLLNPRAGGGRAQRLHRAIVQWLGQAAPGVHCHAVDSIDRAGALLMQAPLPKRVVLVGGDGTVHRMLPALVEARCELALVPVGSGNDTARALGLAGLDWKAALDHGLHATARPMDLGECVADGRRTLFASSFTAGFDSAVGERALRGPAVLRGLPRYLWATMGELAALCNWPMRVELDGAPIHAGPALFASVLNTPTFGSGMPAVPHARIDDGRLDLLIAGRFGRAGTLAMLPRLLAGRHLSHARVMTCPFVEMRAACGVPVPLAGDGESAGMAHAWRVRVLPAALQVVRRAASVG